MLEQKQLENCNNCQSKINGEFCSHCGYPQLLRRIDGKYIASEIGSVLNFDKGILYTIKELLIRPGQNVKNFIHKDRNRLVKPIIFIIISSLIYTLAQQFLNFEDGYVSTGGNEESAVMKIFEWIQKNYGYANILMAIFIAIWIKVFFRKYDYNFFEIIILLCFVMGIGMLIYTLFGIVESVTNIKVLHFGGIIGFVYASWAIGRFFDKGKVSSFIKGFISYFLGSLTFMFFMVVIGVIFDLLIKLE